MSKPRVALVTGANKGIGLAIVQGLVKLMTEDEDMVILTARNENRGKHALQVVQQENPGARVQFLQLDINDRNNIENVRDVLTSQYRGLDILINNAAICLDEMKPYHQQAQQVMETNYFSTKMVCEIFFPILKNGARVVNVSSSAGWLAGFEMDGKEPGNSEIKKRLADPELSVPELDAMMNRFLEDARRGDHLEKGWPGRSYAVTKAGLSALSRIQQRELDKKYPEKDIVVNYVHPGFVDTDMTKHEGVRTVKEGARSSLCAAFLPSRTTIRGKFIWEDCTQKDWVKG